MREKLEQQLAKLREMNSRLSSRNRILAVSCVAAILIIAVAGATALNVGRTGNVVLFSELPQSEAMEVMDRLGEMGVSATATARGEILVPANQEHRVRAALVMMGHPRSGRPFAEYIDHVDMMSTDTDRQVFLLASLETNAANTIRQFDGVFDANVTIQIGTDRRYVLVRDRQEPTAAVTVFMSQNRTPSREMVAGIRHLVAASVAGLNPENVSVLDGFGNLVTERDWEENQTTGMARLRRELEREIERDVHARVVDLLGRAFGHDRVRVGVNARVDVARRIEELIEFRPVHPDDPDSPGRYRGVISDERRLIEIVGEGEVVGGIPGTATNAVIPIYPTITIDGTDIYYTYEEAIQYLVTQFTQQIQNDGGELVDISIGIIIGDDTMTRNQRDELSQVVAMAAGIAYAEAELRVAIISMAFYDDIDAVAVERGPLQDLFYRYPMLQWILLAAVGLLLFIIILLILLVRSARRKRAKEQEEQAAALFTLDDDQMIEEESLDDDDILNTPLDQAKRTREQELKQQIGEFAELNPEIAAQLIKTWLKGGTGDE